MTEGVIEYNINPVLLKIGFLEIRYYGLAYVLGLAITYFMLRHAIRHKKIPNLSEGKLDDLLFYLAIGLVVGARIGEFVFYDPGVFIRDPLEILKIWHGGMSFHGGLIGVVVATFLFCRKYKVKFYSLADNIVMPASIGLFFGRIANFTNGELIGTPTSLPWCINYPGIAGCRHPSQLYEAGYMLLIFGILMLLKKRKMQSGTIFWLFVLLYGVFRFVENFVREDPRFLGLSMGQYLCIGMIIASTIFLYRIRKKAL
ncbi:MAG: prolipoprotein diacylglyceryl transferase [Candidatus Woesearchaeota archaeon]